MDFLHLLFTVLNLAWGIMALFGLITPLGLICLPIGLFLLAQRFLW